MNEEMLVAWKMQTSKKWSDVNDILKYINIDFIDYDHQKLVEFGLKLNSVLDKADKEFSLDLIIETEELLQKLYDYAVYHFDREEIFMRKYNLPDIKRHEGEHNYILNMLKEHLDSFKLGKTKLDMKIKYQVMDWLIKHINIIDHDYFNLKNWSDNLISASDWKEVRAIIHLTGLKKIDQQHMELTELAIRMIGEIEADSGSKQSMDSIVKFQEKIKEHFEFEEGIMKKFDISNLKDHALIHRDFEKTLKEMFDGARIDLINAGELKLWILTWWINHINSIDKNTFEYNNWAYQALDRAKKLDDIDMVLVRTGIEAIDREHLLLMEKVVEYNNDIKEMEDKGIDFTEENNKSIIVSQLKTIIDIARNHFVHEEKLMEEKFNIQSVTHKEEHVKILNKLQGLIDNIESGRMVVSNNLKTMILDWWINHTNIVDYNTFITGLIDGGEKNDQ